MYAVIRTGGKQYRVASGDQLRIEKLDVAVGETVTFEEILLVGDESSTQIGMPTVDGATVTAEVVAQERGEKLTVYKYKRRKGYRRKTGHRQSLTRVHITDIVVGKPAGGGRKKATAAKDDAAAKAGKAEKAEKKAAAAKAKAEVAEEAAIAAAAEEAAEAPVEEIAADAAVEEAPADAAPAEEVSTDAAPAEEVSTDDAPAEEVSTDDATDEAPADEAKDPN